MGAADVLLGVEQAAEYPRRQSQPFLYLSTAADPAETPVAKVLAIIGQQTIVVLAETRAGAPDDLIGRI